MNDRPNAAKQFRLTVVAWRVGLLMTFWYDGQPGTLVTMSSYSEDQHPRGEAGRFTQTTTGSTDSAVLDADAGQSMNFDDVSERYHQSMSDAVAAYGAVAAATEAKNNAGLTFEIARLCHRRPGVVSVEVVDGPVRDDGSFDVHLRRAYDADGRAVGEVSSPQIFDAGITAKTPEGHHYARVRLTQWDWARDNDMDGRIDVAKVAARSRERH